MARRRKHRRLHVVDQPAWLLQAQRGFDPFGEVEDEDTPLLDGLGDEKEHDGGGVGHDEGPGGGEGLAEAVHGAELDYGGGAGVGDVVGAACAGGEGEGGLEGGFEEEVG